MYRYLTEFIIKDLEKKMVFLCGPRQVGKTWLAQQILSRFKNGLYLNYDDFDHRDVILRKAWLPQIEFLILDEIHKMPDWKNYLKGLYDTKAKALKILVTGSARLDTYKFSGDSLAGRYFLYHLMPFTLDEIPSVTTEDQEKLIARGGFPEPFLTDNEDDVGKWRKQYSDGLIRFDILDFERIHDLKKLQLTFEMLRRKVGAPLSYKSIAEDVGVSQQTVKKYVDIFENLYILFRITPFHRNIARSLLKEPKVYFYDTGLVVGDEGVRYENFVAVNLMKHMYFLQDTKGGELALQYIKTKEGKEIDFCIADSGQIRWAIEAKLSEENPSPALNYFCAKYQLPGIQLVKNIRLSQVKNGIHIHNSFEFLKNIREIL